MKVFSYLRVSTKDQKERGTIATQKQAIDEYIRQHPDVEVVQEFRDDGISGASRDRPAFLEMIERLPEVDGIITYDISRLSRDLGVFNYVMFALRDAGKVLIKVRTGEIDNYSKDRSKLIVGFIEGYPAASGRPDAAGKIRDGIKRYKLIHNRWGRKPPRINWEKFDEYRTKYNPPMPISLICQMKDISDRGAVSRSYLHKAINNRGQ